MAKWDPQEEARQIENDKKDRRKFTNRVTKFLAKFPFGKTYTEQKKAYENLVKMVLKLQSQVESLSDDADFRNARF